MSNWKQYFHDLTNVVASNSKCLSRQIGAVIVRDNVVIATGYNGPPRKIPSCGENNPVDVRDICPRQLLNYKHGEGLYLCPATHAEANAIASAARVGQCVKNTTLYVNCEIPCKNCLGLIINSGIKRIVCEHLEVYDAMSYFIVQESKLKIEVY